MLDESLKKIFGQNLKQARLIVGLSRRQFAQELEISAATLGAYERGENIPSLEKILQAVEILKVSLDELFGRGNSTVFKTSVNDYRFKRAVELVRLAGDEVFELESGGYGVFASDAVKNFTKGSGDLLKTDEENKAIVSFETDLGFFDFMEFVEEKTIETGAEFNEILYDVMDWWKNEGRAAFDAKHKQTVH